MALTPSTMLPLGSPLPDFLLPDVTKNIKIGPAVFSNKKLFLVMFICHHCPYVQHVKDELAQLGADYDFKNIGIVAISSNDAKNYPEDAPIHLKSLAHKWGWNFPILYDETQETAKAFRAACTPDFFLFDQARKLIYRGQLDDSRPGNGKSVTGKDLREAIEAGLQDNPVNPQQKPSAGCNIKWKPGNAPDYWK